MASAGSDFDQQFAHVVVQLGKHLAAHQVVDRLGEHRPFLDLDQLEQVGDVGRVERLHQRIDGFLVVLGQRILHAADEVLLQGVLFVQTIGFARKFGRVCGIVQQREIAILDSHCGRSRPVARKSNRAALSKA